MNHPPHLAPMLKKGTALPVLPLCAFMACHRVKSTVLSNLISLNKVVIFFVVLTTGNTVCLYSII
jgi:hypothetical protein